eukprot:953649-Rhodomonas_salina.1
MLRSILKQQAAPVNDPPTAVEVAKQKRVLMDQQLTAYNFLEKKFWKTNPTLFQNVNFLDPSFATAIFTQLDELYRPEGEDDKEGKLDEKDKAFEGFAGDPHAYFERLMRLNRELAELGVPDDTHRNVKRAGDAIFQYATREDATELDKTWKD